MLRLIFVGILIQLISCSEAPAKKRRKSIEPKPELVVPVDSTRIRTDSLFQLIGLVPLDQFESQIAVDLRYAGQNNFMRKQLYDTLQTVYLQREVVMRLLACQRYLDSLKPGFRLLLFDGVRPLDVQRAMWNSLDTVPLIRRGDFVSNPNAGSLHNFGAAVDLTIMNAEGNTLDMGADFDDFRPIAYPSREAEFLAKGELSLEQVENRKLLRKVMRSQHFHNIPSEWWHFNAYTRWQAMAKFEALVNESGAHKKMVHIPKTVDTIPHLPIVKNTPP